MSIYRAGIVHMGKQYGQFFGHPILAEQLARRVRRHFYEGGSRGESSLVVGVFGEWGSGKSNLLHLVNSAMQLPAEPASAASLKSASARSSESTSEAMPSDKQSEQAVIVIVPFNPWRYEKEEHLIVPLLKTVQMALVDHLRKEPTLLEGAKRVLLKGIKFTGMAATAFVSAFSGKLVLPGATSPGEVSFSGKDFLDAFESSGNSEEDDNSVTEPFGNYDSVYFEFQRYLAEVTSTTPGFRLLFLIDDLDRCLPEKAVEMLESIKLFLDVEGCAFVLALDDEVVERGIVHRYRDYLFHRGNGSNAESSDQDPLSHLPITGAEYLEKIVQLPFRLPSPTRRDIRQFLCQREPKLFGEWVTGKQNESRENILLDLFSECIPPVPRKLIRAVEMLKLLIDVLEARQVVHKYDLLPLAKLTLLQLFAPDLYRYGRRYDSGFMTRLEQWVELDYWGVDDFVGRNECAMLGLDYQHVADTARREASFKGLAGPERNDLKLFWKRHVRLYQYFQAAARNRSGFDPDILIRTGSIEKINLTPYFRFLEDVQPEVKPDESISDEAAVTEETVEVLKRLEPDDDLLVHPVEEAIQYKTIVQPVSIEKDTRPVAKIRQPKAFLEQLFSGNAANWQSALQNDELEGRVLADELFESILANLTSGEAGYRGFVDKPEWWRQLDGFISDRQFALAVSRLDAFRSMLPAVNEGSLDKWEPVGLWLVGLNRVRKSLLKEVLEPVQEWALAIVERGRLEPKQRARVGDLLGQVGDPRFHDEELFCLPKVHQGETEDNLGFVKIPAGTFLMGASKKRWLPEAIGEFFGGKKAGLVPDPDAQDNETVHEVTLTQDYYIARYPVTVAQYACYVDQEGVAAPEEWDEQLLYPNRPVVMVSWEDSMAYCRWLDSCLNEKGEFK